MSEWAQRILAVIIFSVVMGIIKKDKKKKYNDDNSDSDHWGYYQEVVCMIECIRTMAKKKESIKPKKEKEEKTKQEVV